MKFYNLLKPFSVTLWIVVVIIGFVAPILFYIILKLNYTVRRQEYKEDNGLLFIFIELITSERK